MSRKDYVAIAGKLAWAMRNADTAETELERDAARTAVMAAASGIADVFAADNGRFDRSRFMDAVRS
jgi:hypothetical protein